MALARRPAVIYGCDLQGIVAAGMVGQALGIPYVYHCYDLYLPSEEMGVFDKRLKPLERLFATRAAGLVFPSESKARLFFRTSRLWRPYMVVANAPLLQPEMRSDALARAIRRRDGRAGRIVLYQGSIGPACGIDVVIRSIPYWPADACLALLGIARPEGYWDRLRALAESVGAAGRVFYLVMVCYDDLLKHTCSADLGLFLPTRAQSNYVYSGTAVNKLMEYMACVVPAVVATFPELRALMKETGAGVVADASDPRSVGQAVAEMLNDRDKWRQCSRSAREAHRRKYYFEHQYAPVLEVLGALTGKARASARAASTRPNGRVGSGSGAGALSPSVL